MDEESFIASSCTYVVVVANVVVVLSDELNY
jgi:hypothetical protein